MSRLPGGRAGEIGDHGGDEARDPQAVLAIGPGQERFLCVGVELRRHPAALLAREREQLVQGDLADLQLQPVPDDAGRAGERHGAHRAGSLPCEQEAAGLDAQRPVVADLTGDGRAHRDRDLQRDDRAHAARPV